MGEPKKFSFGFSKVVKKPALIPAKPIETEQVEYIKCVEENTVKLVNEEANKPKPLPVIPMPPGSSVRDRILEAIKAREEAKSGNQSRNKVEENGNKAEVIEGEKRESGENLKNSNGVETKPLTLDEMAAKELLESAKMDATEEKKPDLVITGTSDDVTKKESTTDDYENMPIGDFGLAMLRGMGWDPKKGIGLNEKVVVPTAPQVRPKGMGLGADKAVAAQNPQSKATEDLIMKKGSMLKVITGPHAGLYGKVEGFEELPGRIAVRLALSNSLVSLNEFMVQLVGPTEYTKNAKVMNLDKYNAALDPESKPIANIVKSEPKYRPSSPPSRRKSRSPSDYREKSSSHAKPKKRDRSRDKASSYKKDTRRSDSSDSDDYRKKKEERRPHKSSKKSKYRSDSSDSDYKSKKKSRDKERSKHSKRKSNRSDSDSDSNSRHHKKHKNKKY